MVSQDTLHRRLELTRVGDGVLHDTVEPEAGEREERLWHRG